MLEQSDLSGVAPQPTAQSCSVCGTAMRCGMLAGDAVCWCTQGPKLPPEALRAGTTCMCPTCLNALRAQLGLSA